MLPGSDTGEYCKPKNRIRRADSIHSQHGVKFDLGNCIVDRLAYDGFLSEVKSRMRNVKIAKGWPRYIYVSNFSMILASECAFRPKYFEIF